MDALSRSSHMPESPPLSEDMYAEFYDIDKPMIQFADGANQIQHVQQSMVEIAKEQAKDKVWREVISWVGQGSVPEKMETREVKQERFRKHIPCLTHRYSRCRMEY